MSRATIIYVSMLLALCGVSFWLGTRQVELIESEVRIDTLYIDNPTPKVDIEPTEPKVVYLTEYRCDTVTITNTIRDSVLVYVPISDFTFRQDSLYTITARGYDVSLTSVEIYNTHTTHTVTSPTKHWSIVASIDSFTHQGSTDLSAEAGIDYNIKRWNISGGYKISTNGNHGVVFRVRRKIFEF